MFVRMTNVSIRLFFLGGAPARVPGAVVGATLLKGVILRLCRDIRHCLDSF